MKRLGAFRCIVQSQQTLLRVKLHDSSFVRTTSNLFNPCILTSGSAPAAMLPEFLELGEVCSTVVAVVVEMHVKFPNLVIPVHRVNNKGSFFQHFFC